jgi:site-specific DNA-methyltransferase (adenine-specific)
LRPYYEQDGITIYHGDCLEILPTLDPTPLTVTSPPYNRGARVDGEWEGVTTESCKSSRFRGGYGQNTDAMRWSDYQLWLKEILELIWAATSGAAWINHKPRIVNGRLWMPTEAVPDESLRQVVVWDTGPGVNCNPGAFTPAHEWIMLLAEDDWRLRSRGAGATGDVWRLQPERARRHPAPFPIELPRRCIAASPGDTVLDPFMGSGTTLVAAKLEGRKAIGIELEERYCEIAAKRLAQGVLPFGDDQ